VPYAWPHLLTNIFSPVWKMEKSDTSLVETPHLHHTVTEWWHCWELFWLELAISREKCTFLNLIDLRLLKAFNMCRWDPPPPSSALTSHMTSDPIWNTRQRSYRTGNGWRQLVDRQWVKWDVGYLKNLPFKPSRLLPNIVERCWCELESFTTCEISLFLDGFGLQRHRSS